MRLTILNTLDLVTLDRSRTLAKYNFFGAFTVASLNTTMSFFFE